ncbi:BatD family protein [Nitrincola tapanii]|uniref:DUF7939 domain-containing protein n=1 Tax=Nitrincola tapanii TaxID=1708751 RepID=A0A5A9W4L8_9GAMM|nr:BatD family protein [Nitrincola tapanii]KAA0875730.1 hypothetical protein E1H14_03305 [Nitrincola tapanii]
MARFNPLRWAFFSLALSLGSGLSAGFFMPAQAELHSSLQLNLDTSRLGVNDRLVASFLAPGSLSEPPDLSSWQDSFLISSPQRSLLTRHTTQGRSVQTRWQFKLQPRQAGLITLAPIEYLGQTTNSLSVRVLDNEVPRSILADADSFVMTSLDKMKVYRNAQALLTFSIYHRDPLPESTEFIPPYLEFGQVRTLGEPRQALIDINRQAFYVTELTYALFPDEVGFVGVEAPGVRIPGPQNADQLELLADNLVLEVMPEAHVSSQGFWLPANDLLLSDQTRSLEDESQPRLIRHLHLIAQGLTSERLPEQLLDAAHYSHYRLLSRDLEEHTSAQGVTTWLQELWLIEPQASGLYEHPGVDLYWWDTQAEQGRVLSTPHSELEIALPEPLMAAPVSTIEANTPWPLAWISLLGGAALLLLAFGSWALQRRGWRLAFRSVPKPEKPDHPNASAVEWAEAMALQQAPNAKPMSAEKPSAPHSSTHSSTQSPAQIADEALAFQILAASCERNDMQAARSALVSWSRSFWPDHAIQGLDAIYEVARNQTLNFLILDLEHHLLHPHEGVWQGDLLLQAIQTLRKRRQLALSR